MLFFAITIYCVINLNKYLHILTITVKIITHKLLIVKEYIEIPQKIPINKYSLIIPLLIFMIPNIISVQDEKMNMISSSRVKRSGVLKFFLNTRKKSKIIPIINPIIEKKINICSCEKFVIICLFEKLTNKTFFR